MPFSCGRSSRQIPTADIKRIEGGPQEAPNPHEVGRSGDTRRVRTRVAILIGCGLLIGLSAFLFVSRGIIRPEWRPPGPTLDYVELATSAFETAVATQLHALPTSTPEGGTSASPAATSAEPASSSIEVPANPWVSQIPEAACIVADLPQTGIVVAVTDGDTIRVLLDGDGRVFSVRYIGVEAPQGSDGQFLVGEATARNAELVYRKQATLVRDITDADKNGSLLRYVMVQDLFVNYALVAGGYARAVESAPDTACHSTFEAAEKQAQASSLGLWGVLLAPLSPAP